MTEQSINLLPLVHRQDIPTPEALLEAALPDIIASIPNATCAQIYRLAWGGMAVWHSVDTAAVPGTFFPLEEGSPYHITATTGESTIDEQYNLLIAPLRGRYGTIFGLMTIECSEKPEHPNIADAITAQLSSALYSKQLEQLLHQQIALTAAFNKANSLEEIAGIFAKNTTVKSQFVAINAFHYAADETLIGAQAVVTANREKTYQVDDDIEVDLDYLRLVYDAFSNGDDFLVSDVATDTRLTESGRAWLDSRKARSIYCLPLKIQDKLYGFITLIDSARALAPTPLEKQIYQNIAEQAATIIEKRNLLEQQEEQSRFLSLLNNLMQQANVVQDEITLLQEMAQILHEVMGLDHVNVSLIDDKRQIHSIVAEYPNAEMVGTEIEITELGLPATLKKTRRPIIIADVENEKTLLSINRDILKRVGIESIVMLPMFDLDGNLIGTVAIDSYTQVDGFDPQKLEAAETIVSQVTVNLQKLRLLYNSQQQATQLQQIAEFGQTLQSSLQLEEILKTALLYGQLVLSGDYIAVMMYDRNIHSLRMSARFWDDKSEINLPGALVSKEADSIAQKAWDEQHLIQLDSVQADWEWEHPQIASLHAMLVAPLMAGGVTLGILELGSMHNNAFSAIDVAAFRQMTNQLSVAVANAETYSQSQRLARNKVKANEIIARIQQQPDVNAILNVTAQELGKALGAKRARIRLGMNIKSSSGD